MQPKLIADAFNRGTTIIESGMIKIKYDYPDGMFTQSFSGESLRVFIELLETSESLEVIEQKVGLITLIFSIPIKGLYMFKPTDFMRSPDEIKVDTKISEDALQFFSGVNLNDGSDVMQRMYNYFVWKLKNEFHPTNITEISEISRWKTLKKLGKSIAMSLSLDTEEESPAEISGVFSILWDMDIVRNVKFTGENKKNLAIMAGISSSIDMTSGFFEEGFQLSFNI